MKFAYHRVILSNAKDLIASTFFRHGLHGLTRFLVYVSIKFIRAIRVIRA